MNINSLKSKLSTFIEKSLTEQFDATFDELSSDELYAYQLMAAGDFGCCVIVASTKNSLKRIQKKLEKSDKEMLDILQDHPDLLSEYKPTTKVYPEIWSAEWEYYYSDGPSLNEISKITQDIYDCLNDGIEGDLDIFEVFEEAFSNGIMAFEKSNKEVSKLFLGFQFADPDESQALVVDNILRRVNKKVWHKKIEEVYGPILQS